MQINVGNGWHELMVLRTPSSLSSKVAVWLIWDDKLPASYAVEVAAKERHQVLFRLGPDFEGQFFRVELSHIPIIHSSRKNLEDLVLMILMPADVVDRIDKDMHLSQYLDQDGIRMKSVSAKQLKHSGF